MRRRINVAQPGPQQRRRLRAGAIGYVQMPVQAVAKIVLGTVGNILGFTADVLG
jgi:translation elongation factor EF-4